MVADGAARASVCCFMSIRSIRGPNGRIVDYAVLGGDFSATVCVIYVVIFLLCIFDWDYEVCQDTSFQ